MIIVLVGSVSLCLRTIFFLNVTAPPKIYSLSLHDALPIYDPAGEGDHVQVARGEAPAAAEAERARQPEPARDGAATSVDRKSTRLNSSHAHISYAVFCLKKKTSP